MINALQHSIICETLTMWAAEAAAGFPAVHEAIYEVLSMLAIEFEARAAALEPVAADIQASAEEICAELVTLEPVAALEGAIVPLATIRSHDLDRHSLFRCPVPHWGITDFLGLHRGCTVTLRKELGKDPQLFSCIDTGRSTDTYSHAAEPWLPPEGRHVELFSEPDSCPFCSSPLMRRFSGEHPEVVCPNRECRAHAGEDLRKFVSVGGMAIPGITDGIVSLLAMSGKIHSVVDLYELDMEDFMEACHVNRTDAYMLVKMVERSKLKPMHMLLDAMCIPGISREDTPALARCLAGAGGMARVASDRKAAGKFLRLAREADVGEAKAAAVVSALSKKAKAVARLAELGVAQVAAGDDGKPLEFNRDGSVRKRPGVHREKPGKRMRRRKRKD